MDFGQYLREARERRGVSLRQIAVSTRISLRTLEALENNEIRKLPGGIFSRAFVRTYAHEVGLDPDETVRRFLQQFPVDDVTQGSPLVADVDVALEDEQERQRQRTRLMIALAVGLPLVALVVYFAFSSRRSITAAADATGEPSSLSASSAPPSTAPGSSPSSSSPSASSSSASAAAAGAGAGASGASVPSPAQATAAAAASGLHVVIQPSGACWVRASADGEVKFQGVLQRGEQQAIEARDAIYLEVGDASMFAFTLNGRPGKSLGGPGKVVRATIRRNSVAEWFEPAP